MAHTKKSLVQAFQNRNGISATDAKKTVETPLAIRKCALSSLR
jgi:hypothetical protein